MPRADCIIEFMYLKLFALAPAAEGKMRYKITWRAASIIN